MGPFRLRGKTALITGGSSGIGKAIAIAFAECDADIILTYKKNLKLAEEVKCEVENMGHNCLLLRADLSSSDGVDRLILDLKKRNLKPNILVNNAGYLSRKKFLNITRDDLESVMSVNFYAPFFLSQYMCKVWIENKMKGVVINISSLSSHITRSEVAHYQCSKAALNMLTKSISFEMSSYGIRSNTISPGLTKTNANKDQWEKNTEAWIQRSQSIPLGRSGVPEDFKSAALLFACDESSWITGAELIIDGGMSVV